MIKSINEEYCQDKDKIARLEKLLNENQAIELVEK